MSHLKCVEKQNSYCTPLLHENPKAKQTSHTCTQTPGGSCMSNWKIYSSFLMRLCMAWLVRCSGNRITEVERFFLTSTIHTSFQQETSKWQSNTKSETFPLSIWPPSWENQTTGTVTNETLEGTATLVEHFMQEQNTQDYPQRTAEECFRRKQKHQKNHSRERNRKTQYRNRRDCCDLQDDTGKRQKKKA